jgi:glycosyltransferase involved in cell wall biosynthesis
MKIALYHNLPSGGAKRATFETVKRLVQEHVVDVYTLSTANHNFCDLRPFIHQHYIFEFQPLPSFYSPWGRLNQLQRWRDLQRLESIAQQIASEIDHRGYDLVYVHPSMWIQAPTVLNYLLTPTVYHLHESLRLVYEPILSRPYLENGWRKKLDQIDPLILLYFRKLSKLDRRNTLQATRLLANSHFTATNIEHIYKRQADVAYFGVDSSTFRPIDHVQKEKFVLSVGELRPNKGFDFLINALARIPKPSRPPLRIIGNASNQRENAYLVNLAEENDVDLTIEVMVDLETLVCRYNQAALLIYAPVREPLGLVPLEAMACATSVVAVAEGGVQETVVNGTTGLLTPRDQDAFAEAIMQLLKDRKQNRQMGRAGRQHVLTEWTWDVLAQQIEILLIAAAQSSVE